MAVDRRHHRLYIGCANKTMVVFDTKKHTIVDTVPIGQGVDATRYDAGLHLAFSSNGEGSLTVVDARSDKVVQTVQTEPGARTMELDDVHHVVYTCTAHVTHMPTPQERAAGQRPQYAPNTFHVLVLQR
jgi:DNA-binding beta-propeller fold protein YncE